jgi:DNA-binding GntR family transcriptional regulator
VSDANKPIYIQIANSLKNDIEKKVYDDGEFLPTEDELIKMFNASRTTVRNAIGVLENSGLVLRKQGKGTIVHGLRTIQKMNFISSITETFKQEGKDVVTGHLSVEMIEASPKIITALELKSPQNVYVIQRTRIIEKEPIAFVKNYLLASKIPNFLNKKDKLHEMGLYQLLEEDYGLILDYAFENINAYLSGPLESEILHIPENKPLFHTNRKTYLQDHTLFEYLTTIIRADLYEYKVFLQGRPSKPVL